MKRICAIITFIFLLSPLYPQIYADYHRTDDLLFKIAIYGPSDEIFIWWGHAALIVENTRWNYSRVFDWGVFYYPGDNFLREFIKDNVKYKCDTGYFDLDFYIDEDRDVAVYTLDLDRKAKDAIITYAENNVLPENSYYDYHEFRDNCSTRIRDVLDIGTDGQFRTAFDSLPGRFSIRQHIRRYTWFRPVSDWFLGFMMGRDLDQTITVWEEMFLPVEIARNIADFSYIDEFGLERSLVSNIQILNSSNARPPVLNAPVVTWPFALVLGFTTAFLLLFVKHMRKIFPRTCRVVLGICHCFLGLFFGGCGCVLFFGLFFMNNDYFQQNINIVFMNPLLLGIVPLGMIFTIDKYRKIQPEKYLSYIWTCVFILAVLSLLLEILPVFYQRNQSVLAIVLPVSFSLSLLPDMNFRTGFT